MKLKYNFVTNKVADRIVAVAVGEDANKFSGFIKMNDTGAYIFNMLKSDVTEDEIVASIEREYDGADSE
ncbi:MAG: PqqD family protein, partial [Acutalibacteraceae bacterium]|nr:PqqD family protein [Acutalibacteraceae bacterium]